VQVVVAVVCIINLATENWQMVWLVTGVVGAVVMGLPQVVEWITHWRARKPVQLPGKAASAPGLAAP
jgi:hypothetical protein